MAAGEELAEVEGGGDAFEGAGEFEAGEGAGDVAVAEDGQQLAGADLEGGLDGIVREDDVECVRVGLVLAVLVEILRVDDARESAAGMGVGERHGVLAVKERGHGWKR